MDIVVSKSFFIFAAMNYMWGIIFFLLPFAGMAYAAWHIWTILPLANVYKWIVLIVLAIAQFSMFFNFLVGLDSMPEPLARVMYNVGYSSIFVLLYLVITFLVLDLGRVVHLIPASFLHSSLKGSLSVLGFIVAVFLYGNIHYYNKVRTEINLTSSKALAKPMKIVMMSDMHLGYHNTREDLAKWVDMINKENPDLVLIAGDIVDFSVVPLIRNNMAEEFRRLNAPVYASLGNHDYYAGEPKSEQFYKESGIQLLRDRSVVVNEQLTIIGRDDKTNKHRKSVEELVAQADKSKYMIMLDHQPYNLENAERNKIDFQFSGHTHYGQVWPISWIEDLIYEDAFGALQKGNTHYYVSSGIGIWGGKFRIGTQSEYVVVTLK